MDDTVQLKIDEWSLVNTVPSPDDLDRPKSTVTVQNNSDGKVVFYATGDDYLQINEEAVCDIEEWV